LSVGVASDIIKVGSVTSLLGAFGKTPVARPALIAPATDAASAITQLNLVIAALEDLGFIDNGAG